jgi:uncharacterized protein (TIGR03435 family)
MRMPEGRAGFVAHALLRAVSRLSRHVFCGTRRCRHECRRSTLKRARHRCGRASLRWAPAIAILLPATLGLAQTAAFETASIKPSQEPEGRSSINTAPGRLTMRNQTLKDCIRIAYDVKVAQVSGGAKWAEFERFDVEAKARRPVGDRELMLMLQALLKDRFKLDLRRETKMVPGYALMQAKGGVKIREVEPGPGHINTRIGNITGESASMANLTAALSELLKVPVLDETGVSGVFTFGLDWTPDVSRPRPGLSQEDPDPSALPNSPEGPSLFAALQEQLGLKLERRKSPLGVLVIERAEKPAAE